MLASFDGEVSGSFALERQIRRLQPELHIFGHSHLTVDNVLEGQRYLQWALGYPQEQKGMSKAVSETGMLVVCRGLHRTCAVNSQRLREKRARERERDRASERETLVQLLTLNAEIRHRFDSGGGEPHVAPMQETFWGRYFAKGLRDPSQTCPHPFVRNMFARMFKVELVPQLLPKACLSSQFIAAASTEVTIRRRVLLDNSKSWPSYPDL